MWNYFNTDEHRTNNVYEAYNKRLNSYFNSKPTILKLINILTIEEEALVKEYYGIISEGYFIKEKSMDQVIIYHVFHILLTKKKNMFHLRIQK